LREHPGLRQRIHAQRQGQQELFAQDLARMDGAHAVVGTLHGGHLSDSQQFHGIGAAVGPGKAEPPLIVDTKAVLPSPIT
jgi:hypothetical protein